MILHTQVNQEGVLQAYLPQFRGKPVVLSVVPATPNTNSNWGKIVSALQALDTRTANRQRGIEEILAELRAFRETQ